jgi:uncharacterized protein (DUF2384 family)
MSEIENSEFIEKVIERATEVLGSVDKANEWVDKKSKTLGANPRVLCETKEGYDQVLKHLHWIDVTTSDN